MKIRPEDFIKLILHVLLGAALLFLSAVAENGETEMSRILVPNLNDVPRMAESLVAGLCAAVGGAAAFAYISKD